MITGALRNQIDKLWTEFWTGGITNPLTVIEQISSLMFSRLLDIGESRAEKRAARMGKPFKGQFNSKQQKLRWSNFKNLAAEPMLKLVRDEVFVHFRALGDSESTFAEYMADAQLMIQNRMRQDNPMATNLFSTYSTGENRVTASILAVLRSLSLDRMQRLLGALLEESEFELVTFQNQPSKGGAGVPDAIIQSSCRLLIETKIERNAIRKTDQLDRHLRRLDDATEAVRRLLVLTPDDAPPAVLDSIHDPRVAWASFAALDQAIDGILDDKYDVISEREEFLLRELQNMLMAEGLVASAMDVVVVPARNAWPEYQQYHAYVCQPDRPFQQVSRLAFCAHGEIHPLVPLILESHEHVEFVPGKHKGRLGELICTLLKARLRKEGTAYKVVFLSSPDAPDTLRLNCPIRNNLTSKAGKPTAFTQNQRYVSSDRLRVAKTTSDLVNG